MSKNEGYTNVIEGASVRTESATKTASGQTNDANTNLAEQTDNNSDNKDAEGILNDKGVTVTEEVFTKGAEPKTEYVTVSVTHEGNGKTCITEKKEKGGRRSSRSNKKTRGKKTRSNAKTNAKTNKKTNKKKRVSRKH